MRCLVACAPQAQRRLVVIGWAIEIKQIDRFAGHYLQNNRFKFFVVTIQKCNNCLLITIGCKSHRSPGLCVGCAHKWAPQTPLVRIRVLKRRVSELFEALNLLERKSMSDVVYLFLVYPFQCLYSCAARNPSPHNGGHFGNSLFEDEVNCHRKRANFCFFSFFGDNRLNVNPQ